MSVSDVSVPGARTLAEAYLYVDLVVSGAKSQANPVVAIDPVREHQPWTTLIEGPDAWTLRYDGPDSGQRHRFDVLVPYQTEWQSRRDQVRFGTGRSELIDAGQWLWIRAAFAGRALLVQLLSAESPDDDDRFRETVQTWEFALAAGDEMAKFLPHDAEEVPLSAFWTDFGRTIRQDNLGRFTREGLESDRRYHRETLQFFLTLHGGSGG